MTALHMAASHDEVEIVKMLIESGANLRCCDEDEATPLHYACMEGSIEVTQLLFAAGEKQDGWVTVSQVGGSTDLLLEYTGSILLSSFFISPVLLPFYKFSVLQH